MDTLPCKGCRGLCCGPVPVTAKELNKIKIKIKKMPEKLRSNLENQTRYVGTCIFYDLENDRCGIHSVRPEICKMFGYYKELVCFRKPELATKNIISKQENPVGILSVDYKWDYFN